MLSRVSKQVVAAWARPISSQRGKSKQLVPKFRNDRKPDNVLKTGNVEGGGGGGVFTKG